MTGDDAAPADVPGSDDADDPVPNDGFDRGERARVEAVVAAMHEGGERIKRRQLERALSRLDHHGTLTDEQRDAVEGLADALVSRLLEPPTRTLRASVEAGERERVAAAIRLFDPDVDGIGSVDGGGTADVGGTADGGGAADGSGAADGGAGVPDGSDAVDSTAVDYPVH